jgi:serralysin
MRFVYPSTPMVDDVYVAQLKYGADMTTRTGNTTYGFNATADVTNAAMSFHTGEMLTVFTIWDAAGNDTLDLSGYYSDSIIDLREGAYSSAGGLGAYNPAFVGGNPSTLDPAGYLAAVNAANAALGYGARTAVFDLYTTGRAGVNEGLSWFDIMGRDTLMENNIGIARGAIIENAIGGHGDDRINGNQANNSFTGGAGADTFVIARYGAGDTSTDTITDFQTGIDIIDLTSFAGVTAANVVIDNANDRLSIDTDGNGSYDFTLIYHGTDMATSDLLFG